MSGQKKTLLIRQKSFEYVVSISSSWNLTYLSRYSSGWSWHLTFSLLKHQQVVKASQDHFPQPFLIRDVVRTGAKIRPLFSYFQIPGFFFGPSLPFLVS